MEKSIELKRPPTALSTHLQPHSAEYQRWIMTNLAALAALMAEPLDEEGMRLTLMATELADLPQKSLRFALNAWRRGDKSHLSEFERRNSKIGTFFPKAAELRQIAAPHAAEMCRRERNREFQRQAEAEEKHLKEHPELYTPVADIFRECLEKRGMKIPVAEIPQPKKDPKRVLEMPKAAQQPSYDGLAQLSPEDLRLLADAHERNRKLKEAWA
jgi:hypothetical protein